MKFKIVPWIVLAAVVLAVVPFLGIFPIRPSSIFQEGSAGFIFWQLRVPRTLLAFLSGAALALAGFIFQNLFKNSLATPYTLGVSSGASAGIVLAIKLNLSVSLFGIQGVFPFGFLGALASVAIILAIARLVRSFSIYTLLMTGVAINFFFSSMIVLVQYLFDFTQTIGILRWLMGGITPTGYKEVAFMFPVCTLFILITILSRNELVIASAGDQFAYSKGLDVRRFRIGMFILVSFVIGMVVSFVGPIGFVGLIVPHSARILCRRNHTASLVLTILAGGFLLVVTDLFARIIIPPAELPVGILTSLLGAPFFILILVSELRKNRLS